MDFMAWTPSMIAISFSPLENGVYFIIHTKKTLLCNGNHPIVDPITKMGVAHVFEPQFFF